MNGPDFNPKVIKKSINLDFTFGCVSLHYSCGIYQFLLLPGVSLQWADLHIVFHAQTSHKEKDE